jgi:hypothetical protein
VNVLNVWTVNPSWKLARKNAWWLCLDCCPVQPTPQEAAIANKLTTVFRMLLEQNKAKAAAKAAGGGPGAVGAPPDAGSLRVRATHGGPIAAAATQAQVVSAAAARPAAAAPAEGVAEGAGSSSNGSGAIVGHAAPVAAAPAAAAAAAPVPSPHPPISAATAKVYIIK